MTNPVSLGEFSAGRRWVSMIAVLAFGAVLLAACGGGDNDKATPTPTALLTTPTAAAAVSTATVAAAASPATAASPGVSPVASPVASPAASPTVPLVVPSPATSVASPAASPAASPTAILVVPPLASPSASPAASPSASPFGSPAASPVGSPSPSPIANAVEIDLLDIRFDPKTFTIRANTDVTVTLKNKGTAPHNFSIDELHIDQDVAPGQTVQVHIKAPAGQYQYYCNVDAHKAAGMVGTLTVQ
ncbi:MAG: cupredoxin domain-containing protein [Thermomicrobiales bacterium]